MLDLLNLLFGSCFIAAFLLYHLLEGFTGSKHRILPISSLRKDREQHVPDSSNHSLYLMKLLSSSYPGETLEESAVRWFDLSVAPMKKV